MPISRSRLRRVSRYELVRQLRQDNLTRTYLATPSALSAQLELVTLELLHEELAKDDAFRALFLDRAATTLALTHDNLATTRDIVSDREACGYTREFVDGQPLAHLLERVGRREIPLTLHLRILCDALRGLEHAHGAGDVDGPRHPMVHGDLSPRSIFITYDGRVKVVGAGFAQSRHALELKLGRPVRDVHYTAPELFLGYPASAAADIYSLGVLLWEALAESRRTFGPSDASIAGQRTRGEEPDIDQVSSSAPRALREICRRALAVSPRDRFDSARALRRAIETFLADTPLADSLRHDIAAPRGETANEALVDPDARTLPERARRDAALHPTHERHPAPALPLDARGAPAHPEPPVARSGGRYRTGFGGTSGFATSLSPTPTAVWPFPTRASLAGALAFAALSAFMTLRWLDHSAQLSRARSKTAQLALHSEAPLTRDASARDDPARGSLAQSAPARAAHGAPAEAGANLVDRAQAGDPSTSPSTAFLTAQEMLPPPRAGDLPVIDVDRTRLQEALVAAARRQRARSLRREAAQRALQRRARTETVVLESTLGAAPRAIDETDPYAP